MIQFLNVLFSYIKNNSYIQSHPVIGWMQVLLFGIALAVVLMVAFEAGLESLGIKNFGFNRAFIDVMKDTIPGIGFVYVVIASLLHSVAAFGIFKVGLSVLGFMFLFAIVFFIVWMKQGAPGFLSD